MEVLEGRDKLYLLAGWSKLPSSFSLWQVVTVSTFSSFEVENVFTLTVSTFQVNHDNESNHLSVYIIHLKMLTFKVTNFVMPGILLYEQSYC